PSLLAKRSRRGHFPATIPLPCASVGRSYEHFFGTWWRLHAPGRRPSDLERSSGPLSAGEFCSPSPASRALALGRSPDPIRIRRACVGARAAAAPTQGELALVGPHPAV